MPSVQTLCIFFLKKLTEGAVTTEAGRLFQCFTTLNENAIPLLRWWLATLEYLIGVPSEREIYQFGSISENAVNIFKAVTPSAQSHHRCKE